MLRAVRCAVRSDRDFIKNAHVHLLRSLDINVHEDTLDRVLVDCNPVWGGLTEGFSFELFSLEGKIFSFEGRLPFGLNDVASLWQLRHLF